MASIAVRKVENPRGETLALVDITFDGDIVLTARIKAGYRGPDFPVVAWPTLPYGRCAISGSGMQTLEERILKAFNNPFETLVQISFKED
jgi:hypothetical protein